MSSALFIRIIGILFGGTIGTYISGHIYNYFNRNIQQPQIQPPEKYELKSIDEEELLNILDNEHINNQIIKNNYEYDNEHGNIININIEKIEDTVINNPLYECSFYVAIKDTTNKFLNR